MTEVETMSKLKHPNIVNLLQYSKDAYVVKEDGRKQHVMCIALELATGGELFDYIVANTRLKEEEACKFF